MKSIIIGASNQEKLDILFKAVQESDFRFSKAVVLEWDFFIKIYTFYANHHKKEKSFPLFIWPYEEEWQNKLEECEATEQDVHELLGEKE